MTILIDYNLDIPLNRDIQDKEMASSTLSDLTSRHFIADVSLSINDACFNVIGRIEPVLNFAISFYDVVRQIQDGETQTINFLEDAESLCFKRDRQSVEIVSTYNDDSAKVSIDELKSVSRSFIQRLFKELSERWPSLSGNPIIMKISELIRDNDSLPIEPALLNL